MGKDMINGLWEGRMLNQKEMEKGRAENETAMDLTWPLIDIII